MEAVWAYVGSYVGPSRAHVERCWAHLGPMLGLCWPMPMLAHVEPSWELCWGHVWAIYVETILRCQLFRPGPPAGAQNHVKTEVLYRRARNTVKKRCFNTASKIHRKLQGLQLTRGSSGVGRRQGLDESPYNLRLPPKASLKDTGSVAGARIS